MIKICHIEKQIEEFSKDSITKDGLKAACRQCRKESKRLWNLKNKERIKEYNKKYSKEYYIENKERLKEHQKEYRSKTENKKRIKEQKARRREITNQHNRDRRADDVNFRLVNLLRKRVWSVLKGFTKSARTMELVGCSIDFAREHLQKTAIKNGYINFDINNFSGRSYHIDHVVPCSSFDLTIPANQFICFNWTNLQILSAKENMSKGDKVITKEINIWRIDE
jgi:hypothetical protein